MTPFYSDEPWVERGRVYLAAHGYTVETFKRFRATTRRDIGDASEWAFCTAQPVRRAPLVAASTSPGMSVTLLRLDLVTCWDYDAPWHLACES